MRAPFPRVAWTAFWTTSLKVAVAGCLLGAFRTHDRILALLLGMALIRSFWRWSRMPSARRPDLLLMGVGTGLTLLLGAAAETWGTHSGHWTYHGLGPGRLMPEWLPLGWALAYHLLYGLEWKLSEALNLRPGLPRLGMAALACVWLPWLGEVTAIASGVWTYHWPLRLAGVPLLAVGLLVVAHLGIFALVSLLARGRASADPVYGVAVQAESAALPC